LEDLPALAATGIGSVPFQKISETIERIAQDCPDLPYWPQMIYSHPLADMILQFASRLPFLNADIDQRRITPKTDDREDALTEFYEHFLEGDLDYFALSRDSAAGFYAFLARAKTDPCFGSHFLKGHVTGPITIGQAVRTEEGKPVINDPVLADPIIKGLGAMAAWQAREIRANARNPLIFLDEPSLSGFGSAFSTLNREEVLQALNETIETARSNGPVLIGMHICGNTDWGMVLSSKLDVINFDAFGYLDNFLLYSKDIIHFIKTGGYVAWGIAPTLAYTEDLTPAKLASRLEAAFQTLVKQGLDKELLLRRSILTPACGLGPLSSPVAGAVSELVARTSEVMRENWL